MLEFLIILTLFVGFIFLILGLVSHFKQTGKTGIYLTFSTLSLFSFILLFSFPNLDFKKFEKTDKNMSTNPSDNNQKKTKEKKAETSSGTGQKHPKNAGKEQTVKKEIQEKDQKSTPVEYPIEPVAPIPTTPPKIEVPEN